MVKVVKQCDSTDKVLVKQTLPDGGVLFCSLYAEQALVLARCNNSDEFHKDTRVEFPNHALLVVRGKIVGFVAK